MDREFPLKKEREGRYRHPAFIPTSDASQALNILETSDSQAESEARQLAQPLGWQACIGGSNLGYFSSLKNMESSMRRKDINPLSLSRYPTAEMRNGFNRQLAETESHLKILSPRNVYTEEDFCFRMAPSVLNRLNPPSVLQALSNVPVPMSPQAKEIRDKGRLSGLGALTQGVALISMAPSVLTQFNKMKKNDSLRSMGH
ncbi:MAG: hypothetical protein ACOY3I_09080 [Verrucomicrobiota bacterium]